MFQMGGIGPMFGQLGFFHKFAGKDYEDKRPRDRYVAEAKRLLGVLEQRLAGRDWIMGDAYTIADIAIFPWVRNLIGFYEARRAGRHRATSRTCSACLQAFLARPGGRHAGATSRSGSRPPEPWLAAMSSALFTARSAVRHRATHDGTAARPRPFDRRRLDTRARRMRGAEAGRGRPVPDADAGARADRPAAAAPSARDRAGWATDIYAALRHAAHRADAVEHLRRGRGDRAGVGLSRRPAGARPRRASPASEIDRRAERCRRARCSRCTPRCALHSPDRPQLRRAHRRGEDREAS